MWPGTSTSLSWHGFPSIFQIVSFLVFPLRFPGFWSWQWVTIVLWMRNLFAPSCLLDSSDKTQWPFLQTRDTGCVGGSASTSLWSEAVMVHFPRWNDQNEICKEKRYWNGKSWALLPKLSPYAHHTIKGGECEPVLKIHLKNRQIGDFLEGVGNPPKRLVEVQTCKSMFGDFQAFPM